MLLVPVPFLSRRACLFALFGRASRFLAFFRGASLGPARFWDSPGTLLRPFSGREAARVFWLFLSIVFVFPFCCVLRLFSHQLEGVDPSSYVAYPRVVVPAPRPSEGPGAPSCAPVWTRAKVSGYFFASLCLADGHRDPRDHFGRGGGAFCPLRSLLHTHTHIFVPAPGFFFFGPLGPRIRTGVPDAIRVTCCVAHQKPTKQDILPPLLFSVFCPRRGKCCAFFFFPALFFRRMPPFCSQKSILLGFCKNTFRGANFWFKALLSILCVLVLYCLLFAIIIWILSPES